VKFGDFKGAQRIIGWPYSQEESEIAGEDVVARVESILDSNCILLNSQENKALVGQVFFSDFTVYVAEEKEL